MNDDSYRSRGYLSHLEIHGSTYFVTLRLAGTLPRAMLSQIRMELKDLSRAKSKDKLNAAEEQLLKYLQTKKIQDYLDSGAGECWLTNPEVAALIKEAVEHHDGHRYVSHVCCIMPNHLHWILTPKRGNGMGKLHSRIIPIIQKFKSFTAHAADKVLQRNGPFWSREYYDHRVRTSEEFYRFIRYTILNPVKAKLCSNWKQWPWTICSKRLFDALCEDDSL